MSQTLTSPLTSTSCPFMSPSWDRRCDLMLVWTVLLAPWFALGALVMAVAS